MTVVFCTRDVPFVPRLLEVVGGGRVFDDRAVEVFRPPFDGAEVSQDEG
ncbi:MAG: hypothetical protein QOH49_4802 [Acidobacteriota bacterium]|jgi:hypothetical protein|nr:hypothetical protein [Acidobacteriota bacterium]